MACPAIEVGGDLDGKKMDNASSISSTVTNCGAGDSS
jgi:hypothetical protein